MNKKPVKIPARKEYKLPQQAFDAYNKDVPVQDALGSRRIKARQEAADIRSVNWKPGVSGWRLTPTGIEIGDPNFTVPVGDTASVDLGYTAGVLKASTIGLSGTYLTADGFALTFTNGLLTAVTLSSASLSRSPSSSSSASQSPSASASPSSSSSASLSPSSSPSPSP